jgi:two-component system, chemotaxis family, CheB/CheR fusion protein
MNGYQTIAAMRKQPWSRHALICTLSGHGLPVDRRRSAEAGAQLHIVKPIGRDELREILRKASAGKPRGEPRADTGLAKRPD